MENQTTELISCSFCKKEYVLGQSLIIKSNDDNNNSICICAKCIDTCFTAAQEYYKNLEDDSIFEDCEDMENENISEKFLNFKPSLIKKAFDDYIINQDKAKIKLAVAVYNHYKRTKYNLNEEVESDIKLKKSNILMIGPSGSGKTLFVETIARLLNIPFAIQDATSLTESGYVGDDVEVCLKKLIESANGDIQLAERGIIFLDEVDKLGRKGENLSISRDVSGEGVQQALLKMLDGSVVNVFKDGNRKHPSMNTYSIDTSNILFICAGAFEGIEKLIEKRESGGGRTIGLISNNTHKDIDTSFNSLIHKVTQKDLRKFGMMPELLGRLPIICTLEKLNLDALISILTEPVDSIIKQYKKLFELDNVELEFTDEALECIAKKAYDSDTGARALKTIVEEIMTEYMYKIPDLKGVSKVIITDGCVNKTSEALIEYK